MKKKTQHWKKAKAAAGEAQKLPPFPARIFVKWDDNVPLNDPYLSASETSDGFEDGDRVAVYELKETHTLKVTRQLT